MPALRTEITEIITGLGMLGLRSLDSALSQRPSQFVNVGADQWDKLLEAREAGNHDVEFAAAWANGNFFLTSPNGLRGHHPVRVEWKGPQRPPGYDLIPADLRVDHVYLISCKYVSRILFNPSPWHLFERGLSVRSGLEHGDWYLHTAPAAYQHLYDAARKSIGRRGLPAKVGALTAKHRQQLKRGLVDGWPHEAAVAYEAFCTDVGRQSALVWRKHLKTHGSREEMLWRLIRLASAPYFVLGSSRNSSMRLRVHTPWDWRQEFRLLALDVEGDPKTHQPVVRWAAAVEESATGATRTVEGHVEVRWSHGRFQGNPEAKVYLDSPHQSVPGYAPL